MGLAAVGTPRWAPSCFLTWNGDTFEFHDELGIEVAGWRRWPDNAERWADLAASAQQALEHTLADLLARLRADAPEDVLCLSGGVALNGVANEGPVATAGWPCRLDPAMGRGLRPLVPGAALVERRFARARAIPPRLVRDSVGPVHPILLTGEAAISREAGRSPILKPDWSRRPLPGSSWRPNGSPPVRWLGGSRAGANSVRGRSDTVRSWPMLGPPQRSCVSMQKSSTASPIGRLRRWSRSLRHHGGSSSSQAIWLRSCFVSCRCARRSLTAYRLLSTTTARPGSRPCGARTSRSSAHCSRPSTRSRRNLRSSTHRSM